jgi:hypothetical protein
MRRREEVGAKVKLLNCFVLAIVLLSVSALSGAVVCAAQEHPSGPVPTEITVTVAPQSIPVDGTTQSTITACARDNDEASGGYILTFEIEDGPDDVELIPVLDGGSHSDTAVWDETDENGYAHATLKAGTTEGQVTIKVSRGEVSGTAGVTLKEQGERTGDMNGDGNVTFDDVILLAKHIYFDEPVNDEPDVNSDGNVTFDDVILLAKHIYFGELIYA